MTIWHNTKLSINSTCVTPSSPVSLKQINYLCPGSGRVDKNIRNEETARGQLMTYTRQFLVPPTFGIIQYVSIPPVIPIHSLIHPSFKATHWFSTYCVCTQLIPIVHDSVSEKKNPPPHTHTTHTHTIHTQHTQNTQHTQHTHAHTLIMAWYTERKQPPALTYLFLGFFLRNY